MTSLGFLRCALDINDFCFDVRLGCLLYMEVCLDFLMGCALWSDGWSKKGCLLFGRRMETESSVKQTYMLPLWFKLIFGVPVLINVFY